MKYPFIVALMSLAASAHASTSAEAIYNALSVEAKPACDPSRGDRCPNSIETKIKSVGGLKCSRTETMAPGNPVSYECSLRF